MKKKRLSKKVGLPPGSPVYTGTKTSETVVKMIIFTDDDFKIYDRITVEKAITLQAENATNWILVRGLSKPDELQKLGTHFGIHPLIIEDIFNVEHMPKVEDLDNGVFITLKNLSWLDKVDRIDSEQISIYMNSNMLITFEDKDNKIFEPIIERLRTGKSRGRQRQEDYLCYLLIDQIVDNYYILLDHTEEEMEELEKTLIENPTNELTGRFLQLKKNLMVLRKTIYPLKEEIRFLSREDSGVITEYTRQYLNDISDHLSFIIQSIDNFRDMIASMMDLMMANSANRMNGIMKTLTLVSTIFIPLTLLSSIYGMNFDYMPELRWKFGYPFFLLIIFSIGMGMYIYMKRRKWF